MNNHQPILKGEKILILVKLIIRFGKKNNWKKNLILWHHQIGTTKLIKK